MNSNTFNWASLVTATNNNIANAEKAKLSREEVQAMYRQAIISIGDYANKEVLLNTILSNLKNISTTWAKVKVDGNHPDGFAGYQSQLPIKENKEKGIIASPGVPEAITYNAFQAWARTNVDSKSGIILSADDKTKGTADVKAKKEMDHNLEVQERIDNAVNEAVKLASLNMVDKSEIITLTEELCIQFMISKGFIQTTNKKGQVVLTSPII